MKETDLYIPVKNLFEEMGYQVNSEVNNIDIVAVKDNIICLIELKTSLNIKLLIQGIKRQRITNNVYVAIPRPTSKKRFSKDIKDKEHLVRRLELGLIYVSTNVKNPYASIVFDPAPFDRNKSLSRSKKNKTNLLKELSNRSGDNNTGGTNGKIITAYREKSLLIAWLLNKHECMSTKEIKTLTKETKATSILYNNYYSWFNRIDRGIYELNTQGKKALIEYKDIVNKIVLSREEDLLS
jgi:hypothetical protein